MSVPKYRLDAIETIGRKILQEYDPALLDGPPQAVPIETIIETKFDLTLEYHCLRKNGSILGETIFDEGAAILYDQDEKRYRLIAVKAGTILVEERLCVDRLLGRLRFTCAHELGHWVLHQKLYSGTGDVAAYEGKTSLDEIPQFINVLKGDMSLIGPRPLVEGELDAHKGNPMIYQSVRPGISGWWAANGRSATTYEKRLELEYYYCKNCNLILDIKCVFLTIAAVLFKTGAK